METSHGPRGIFETYTSILLGIGYKNRRRPYNPRK